MTTCLVMHNTGLGDYIMMSGAVRHLLSLYDEVHLVVVSKKLDNIKFLYKDEIRILLIPEPDANSSQQGTRKAKKYKQRYVAQGHDARAFFWSKMTHWETQLESMGLDPSVNHWCESFYKAVGVDYSERYNSFYIERDREREERLYEKVVSRFGSTYSFVANHQCKRGCKNLLIPDRIVVNPQYWEEPTLIFDWMKVIENADIIHTIDTSYMHLIKQMRLKNKNQLKFFHRYARHCPATNGNYINDDWDNRWIDLYDEGQMVCLEE